MVPLSLAREARFEHGSGFVIAELPSREEEAQLKVRIDSHVGRSGRRRLHSAETNPLAGYWLEPGSSGSPVFLDQGQQLAGLASVAELGSDAQSGQLREAFAVPATTIWRYVERAVATPVAERENIDVSRLDRILRSLGEEGVPAADIPERLELAFDAMRAHAAVPAEPARNLGADVTSTVADARRLVDQLDVEGALSLLRARRAETMQMRLDATQREIELLTEQAQVERLALDHAAARETLVAIVGLDPDNRWAWVELGDAWQVTGPLSEALFAFTRGLTVARQSVDETGEGICHDRIGDVLQSQGNLNAALDAFNASLAIAQRLAAADPGNAGWQRDLIVSYVRFAHLDPGEARFFLGRALEVAKALEESGCLAPRDAWMPDDLQRRIADLKPI